MGVKLGRTKTNREKPFQPQILDENGKLRSRIDVLYQKTKIQKDALIGKALDVGLVVLEKTLNQPTATGRQRGFIFCQSLVLLELFLIELLLCGHDRLLNHGCGIWFRCPFLGTYMQEMYRLSKFSSKQRSRHRFRCSSAGCVKKFDMLFRVQIGGSVRQENWPEWHS